MPHKYLQNSIVIMLRSILASALAGASMGLLNIAIELLKNEPLLKLYHFYLIASWHVLVWLIPGIFLGLAQIAYFLLTRRFFFRNQVILFYSYLFFVIWLLILWDLNVRILGPFFSFGSIACNATFLFIGVASIFVLKRLDRNQIRCRLPGVSLIVYGIAAILMFISSYVIESGYLADRKNSRSSEKNVHKNVIILVLDAVRADHMSCYGYGRKTTPNIDIMASEGVLFERAFSCSSHTAESVPSLLSSTYPSTHNVRLWMYGSQATHLPKKLIVLPTILKSNGYKTSLFSVGVPISSIYGFDRDIDDYYEPQKNILNVTILANFLARIPWGALTKKDILGFSYSLVRTKHSLESTTPDYVIQKAVSWISHNQRNPFFTYIHLFGAHLPYDPPKDYERLFGARGSLELAKIHPERAQVIFPFNKQEAVPPDVLSNMISLYDAEIFYHDIYVGALMSYLKTTGLIRNTVVIVTSDHGEEFYDHYGWGHIYSLFDELVHVPLIFFCPDTISKGKRIDRLISHVDLFPTILSLCEVGFSGTLPYKIEGLDYSGLLVDGNSREKRERVFSEVNITKDLRAYSLRTGVFKAIEVISGPQTEKLFFDLADDPDEKNNLYTPKNVDIVNIFSELESVVRQSKEKSFEAHRIFLDKRTREQLRALGYIR